MDKCLSFPATEANHYPCQPHTCCIVDVDHSSGLHEPFSEPISPNVHCMSLKMKMHLALVYLCRRLDELWITSGITPRWRSLAAKRAM
jgi:hypothetical protein